MQRRPTPFNFSHSHALSLSVLRSQGRKAPLEVGQAGGKDESISPVLDSLRACNLSRCWFLEGEEVQESDGKWKMEDLFIDGLGQTDAMIADNYRHCWAAHVQVRNSHF